MKSIINLFVAPLLVVGVVLYFSLYGAPKTTSPQQQVSQAHIIGERTKTANCQVNIALQDQACTPGAIDTSLTKDIICNSSFTTKSVRNVPDAEKQQVYSEYTITAHQPGEYEVDHLISLELGGSNDIANLWPEAAEPRPGFHEKDMLENYLHKQVCDGAMTLQDAQQKIATNWLGIYQSIHDIQNYGYSNSK